MNHNKWPLFVAAILAGILFDVPAQASLTAATVKGSYSFEMNEWTTTTGSNDALLGILKFDGISGVTGSVLTVTSTGLQAATILSGSTYLVKTNGSGSMILKLSPGGTLNLDFILNGVTKGTATGLQLMVVNSAGGNFVIAGTASVINLSGSASAANLKGRYSFTLNRWTADTADNQDGIVGTITFDGVSKVSVSISEEKGGILATGTLNGTYSVQANGSGSITLTVNSGQLTIFVVLNSLSSSIARNAQMLTGDSITDKVTTGMATHQ